VIVVGDSRAVTPSGKTDLHTFADGRVVPGPSIATLMVEHIARRRPTRVPNTPEAVVILAIAASAGVFIRVLAYECGPLIPSITLLTGALLAAVVFSRFVRVHKHTITLAAQV
jgi:hypothetical protein